MAKSRKKKRKIKKAFFSKKKIALVVLAFFFSFAVVYSINYFELIKASKHQKSDDMESTKVLMDKMKKMLDAEKKRLENLPKPKVKEKKEEILPPVTYTKKEESKKADTQFSEITDYKKSKELHPKKEYKKPLHVEKNYSYKGKPKLAIIIDDVAFSHQVKLIKKIPFKVTPSFFPPTKRHPDTVKLSHQFTFAMIHLPTEALSFSRPENATLLVGDSYDKIKSRIKQIKNWFPHIKYYNNHTGSKFTADLDSMKKLLKVMRNEGLIFVDSRTTAATKAPVIAKKDGFRLISRDVFIDNSSDKKLIRKQLRKAVKIAKKRGYAVAIGHPHTNTLEVLINAKPLLKDVDLVYIKEL